MTALVVTLLAGSMLSIAVVQLCNPWLRRLAGPSVTYACWLLPWLGVLASLLPAQSAFSLFGQPSGLLTAPMIAGAVSLLEAPACRSAVLVWTLIATVFFLTHLAAYWLFVRAGIRHAAEYRRSGAVNIYSGRNVSVPFAAGVLHPRIFLPADFDLAFTPDEQLMILRHEQAHHERLDIIANLAGLLMLSLHWWNPLAYLAHRRFRADQELACDATVIADLGCRERHAYGMAILKCAKFTRMSLVAAMSGRSETACRLSAIASDIRHKRPSTLPVILIVALLAGLVVAGNAATHLISALPRIQAATPASSSRGTSPLILACLDPWHPTTQTPLLMHYRRRRPAMRLIAVHLTTGCIETRTA